MHGPELCHEPITTAELPMKRPLLTVIQTENKTFLSIETASSKSQIMLNRGKSYIFLSFLQFEK